MPIRPGAQDFGCHRHGAERQEEHSQDAGRRPRVRQASGAPPNAPAGQGVAPPPPATARRSPGDLARQPRPEVAASRTRSAALSNRCIGGTGRRPGPRFDQPVACEGRHDPPPDDCDHHDHRAKPDAQAVALRGIVTTRGLEMKDAVAKRSARPASPARSGCASSCLPRSRARLRRQGPAGMARSASATPRAADDSDTATAARPISHSANRPPSGQPTIGNRPVQFGTAVSRNPAMTAAR